MDNSTDAINPELIYSLYIGIFKPQLVRMALLLDVFTPLAKGPVDTHTVANECGCDETGIHALLDYLYSIKLLEQQNKTYSLTPTAAKFLVPGKKTYVGDWLLMEINPELWDNILQKMRGKEQSYQAIPWAQDAILESYRKLRIAESREMWHAAGFKPGKHKGLHILDLACGCAIKSFVLAKDDKTIRVTCIDSKKVLKVARDLAYRFKILQQVTFVPGNINSVNLGEENYNAVLLGQITDYLTPEQNIDLFKRIHKALIPSGIIIIDVPMSGDKPEELSCLVTLLTWSISGGGAHSFANYNEWLQKQGFTEIKQHNDKWLSAKK